MKLINQTLRYIKRSSLWFKLGILLVTLYVLFHTYYKYAPVKEGFTQSKKYVLKQGSDIYDDFYVDYYDELLYDPLKNNYELGEMKRVTKMDTKKSYILDIGSGTGKHLHELHDNNYKCVGLDQSKAMIDYAKQKYPDLDLYHGDATQSIHFPSNTLLIFRAFTLQSTIFKIRAHSSAIATIG